MLALLTDYLFGQVFVFNSVYHYTAWTTRRFSKKSYLTVCYSIYQNTCQLKVPFSCSRYLPAHFYHFQYGNVYSSTSGYSLGSHISKCTGSFWCHLRTWKDFCNAGISFSQVTELPKPFSVRVVQLCICLVNIPQFCFIEK